MRCKEEEERIQIIYKTQNRDLPPSGPFSQILSQLCKVCIYVWYLIYALQFLISVCEYFLLCFLFPQYYRYSNILYILQLQCKHSVLVNTFICLLLCKFAVNVLWLVLVHDYIQHSYGPWICGSTLSLSLSITFELTKDTTNVVLLQTPVLTKLQYCPR